MTRPGLARSVLPIVLVTGALLVLTGLRVGFILDDYFQLAVLGNPQATQSSLSLWSWASESQRPLSRDPVQGGWLPWWTSPDFRINFFRPLPSLLHLLDYRLYGLDVRGWRITTLAVWLLLLWAVLRLYKELAGQAAGVILLAGLFFAVDESHAWSTVWLAARHSLIAALFVVAAAGSYIKYRRSGSRGSLIAALLFTVLGLLSSEIAVGVLAWVIAYETTLAREDWKARLRVSAPFFLLVGAYASFYAVAGFGSRANVWYIDPIYEPVAFLRALPERLPALFQGLITPIAPEIGPLFGLWSIALPAQVVALLVSLAFLPRLRHDPMFRFAGLATLLSLLPLLLARPINYLLLLPSVGAAWLFASFLAAWWQAWKERRERPDRWPLLAAPAAVFLLIAHGLVAPVMFALDVEVLQRAHQRPANLVETAKVPAGMSRVVLVTSSNRLFAGFMGLAWPMLTPSPGPDAVWMVSPALGPHRFVRTGERSFRLEIPEPGILGSLWDKMVSDGSGVAAGSRFQQGAMQVEVLRMEDEGIREIEVTIDRPLDAPDVCLLAWNGERLAPIRVPGIGGRAVLSELEQRVEGGAGVAR